METLAAQFIGYELVDDSHMHPKTCEPGIRKTDHPVKPAPAEQPLAHAVEKYVRALRAQFTVRWTAASVVEQQRRRSRAALDSSRSARL